MDYANANDLLSIYGNRNPISNFIFDRQIADQEKNRQLKMADQQQITRGRELANVFDEQNNPLKLEDQRLKNTSAGTKNQSEILDLELKQKTQQGRIDSTLRKQVLEASDSDLKMMENAFQQMAYSRDPNLVKQGQAGLQMHRDFIKMREEANERRKTDQAKFDHDYKLENIRAGNNRALEEMRIGAGKYSRGKSSSSVNDALGKVRNAAQAAEILENAYYDALSNGDMQQAEQYKQRALAARQRAAEDAQNRSVGAPGVVLDPTAGGLIPKPTPQAQAPIANNQRPLAAQQNKTPSLSDVQKMYPGIPPAKLKEAYKQKFGVDLQ